MKSSLPLRLPFRLPLRLPLPLRLSLPLRLRPWLLLSAFSLQAFSLSLPAASSYGHFFQNTLVGSTTMWLIQTGTYYHSPGKWELTGIDFINTNQAGNFVDTSAIDVNANATDTAVLTLRNITAYAGGTTSALRRQALSVRNSATVAVFSSTLVKEHPDDITDFGGTVNFSETVNITGRSSFYGEDILIQTIAPQVRALNLASDSQNTATLHRATLATTGSAAALSFSGAGAAFLNSTTIATTGNSAPGIQFVQHLAFLDYNGGSIHTTGENSPGLWLGAGNTTGHFKAELKNVDIRAERGAALDINTHIPGLLAGPAISSAAGAGSSGLFELYLENTTLSGARGSVRITSSATSADTSATAEIPTRAILTLNSSTLAGDVTLRGSAARLELTLADSVLEGSLQAFDNTAAVLKISGATLITGTLAATGASTLEINLDRHTLAAPIALAGAAAARVIADNASRVAAPIAIAPGATLRLQLAAGASGAFRAGAINLAGRLHISSPVILDDPLTLAGPGATIVFANAKGDDLTLAAGATGSATLVVESLAPGILGQPEIRLVADHTNALAPGAFALAGNGAADFGLATYTLESSSAGAFLVIGPPSSGGYVGALLNATAAAPGAFFHSLAPAHAHLAALRETTIGPGSPARSTHAKGDTGALWLRLRTTSLSADSDNLFPSFDQTTHALTAGADLKWDTAAGNTLTTGVFADIATTDFDFASTTTAGNRSAAAGLYASWLHPAGWFATATARFDSLKHKLDARAAASPRSRHNNAAIGGALETGRGFTLRSWWLEPVLQAAYVHFDSAEFTTDSGNAASRVAVRVDPARAFRALAAFRASRAFADSPFSLQTRIAAARTEVSGGSVRIAGLPDFTRHLDGWSAEAAIGAACKLGAYGRLSIECEHTIAAKHTRPWAVTAGWSINW